MQIEDFASHKLSRSSMRMEDVNFTLHYQELNVNLPLLDKPSSATLLILGEVNIHTLAHFLYKLSLTSVINK